jgi:hypothetical protein
MTTEQQQLDLKIEKKPEQQPPVQSVNPKLRKKNCAECDDEFETASHNARFCSASCKWKHENKRGKEKNMKPDQQKLPSLQKQAIEGASPQASIAIDLLRQEARRWEDMYREERDSHKKDVEKFEAKCEDLTNRFENAKDELAKLKVDQKIELIENAKPSGLQGLADNPLVMKLMDHVGPALGAIMMKLSDFGPPAAGQMAGTDGQLDEISQGQLHDINQWFLTLPVATRAAIHEAFHSMSEVKTNELLLDTVVRFNNMIKNGSTVQSNQNAYQYGNM